MSLDDVLQTRLRLREPGRSPEWRIWEHKTFNIHRAVLQWQPAAEPLSFARMSQSIIERVRESFQISWWRGFGFGVLIEAPAIPVDIATIDSAIDTRAQSKGTWQWTVLACPKAQVAIGSHTWTEGYLSPIYRGLIGHYESMGYEVGSFTKEKDELMRFLTAVAGLKGIKFTGFK